MKLSLYNEVYVIIFRVAGADAGIQSATDLRNARRQSAVACVSPLSVARRLCRAARWLYARPQHSPSVRRWGSLSAGQPDDAQWRQAGTRPRLSRRAVCRSRCHPFTDVVPWVGGRGVREWVFDFSSFHSREEIPIPTFRNTDFHSHSHPITKESAHSLPIIPACHNF